MLFPKPVPVPPGAPRTTVTLLQQGKWWKSANGWIRIKHMTPAHRANVARGLMRQVDKLVMLNRIHTEFTIFDAPDGVWNSLTNELSSIDADPATWLRNTKLYRKLTRDAKPDLRVDDETTRRVAPKLGMHVSEIDA